MLLTLKRWIARRLRRALGVDEILEELRRIDSAQRRGLLITGNALASWLQDPETVRASPVYARCTEIVDLVRPCAVEGIGLVRIGGPNDGGYVMLDTLRPPAVTAAYSLGAGHDVSWDNAVAALGIDVFLHDHTVDRPAALHPRCRFRRTGVTGLRVAADLRTLAELIATHGHEGRRDLVLKMDVEGAEWDVLDQVATSTLEQFHQIVVEWHGLSRTVDPGRRGPLVAALQKISRSHQSIHVHGNGDQPPMWIGDLVVPDVLEVTYVRRQDVADRLGPATGPFPSALDQPTNPGWPDVFLGQVFSARPGHREPPG